MDMPMKLLVLGAGGMGSYAAKTAVGFPYVEELVVADLDRAAAKRLADDLGPKARAERVDVTDPGSLDPLLGAAEAVLNTVGPFFRFGPPVLAAAIRAGCHYLDINDDWESTEAMLARHDDARAAGITALIGMGASPGMSNLLATTAARELDVVEELYAGFDLDAAMPETRGDRPAAATIHGVHQLTGTIRLFEDGRLVEAPAMRRLEIDYPGLGRFPAWTMGHPEAISFPRRFPGLRRAIVVMTMDRTNIFAMRVLAMLLRSGVVSLERVAGWVERLEGVGKPPKAPADYVDEIAGSDTARLPPLFALARGTRGGEAASVAAAVLSAPAVGMGGATGVPLALGLDVLRPDGEAKRGVYAPEGVLDPDAFFDRIAPLCSPAKRNRDDLLLLSRSWEDRDLRTELRTLA